MADAIVGVVDMHEIPVPLTHAFRDLVAASSELVEACERMGDRGMEISAPKVREALAKIEEARHG